MMTSFLWTLLTPQLDEARRFWKNKQIRTALIVPWAEAFTAAFLTPVIPYFYQSLGLQAVEMGQLRTVQLVLNAASAPIAGVLLDRHGPFIGIALLKNASQTTAQTTIRCATHPSDTTDTRLPSLCSRNDRYKNSQPCLSATPLF